jgi:hypothetical protein
VIPYLEAQLAGVATSETQRSAVREYLQMRILQSLQRAGAMIPLAFHGGTALRILYQLPRYSEDLDFALERHPEQYDLRNYLTAIQRDLTAETYVVEIKLSDQKAVHSAFIRFLGLFYRLGLSPHETEVLAIKLEIDTTPPNGAVLAPSLVRSHVCNAIIPRVGIGSTSTGI